MLFVALTLVVGLVAAALVAGAATDPGFSPWMTVAGSAVKYWVGAFGILLVVSHLRHFVAAGLTRRAVLAGGSAVGALLSLTVTLLGALLCHWLVRDVAIRRQAAS
ncbi:hypothetical protein [Couchioplanes caeruleus]|uniref:Uncharacterized protein n=2 Tax=Couchioplanes caeruleus TaxID=56438 RepID=A0A1K0FLP3_9ACTN|nr:hypothetical protein [Couchioplanes caeruleus]OJF13729.1 hypothetical protein BG844_13790 [Couchioplanes caeruleus subsp. caeruleus]ROP32451.1 hypothetical protein EDD30_5393 [Couchioplanes caeruleus]